MAGARGPRDHVPRTALTPAAPPRAAPRRAGDAAPRRPRPATPPRATRNPAPRRATRRRAGHAAPATPPRATPPRPPPPPRTAAPHGGARGAKPAPRGASTSAHDGVGVHDAVAVEPVAGRGALAGRGVVIRQARIHERVLRRARRVGRRVAQPRLDLGWVHRQ